MTPAPRVRFSISCTETEWERIREAAEARGVSINEHVISAGLSGALDAAPADTPVLALSEAEQRRLLERVDALAESMLSASGGSIVRLRRSVETLLAATLEDMVREGRKDELLPLLTGVFGEEDARIVEAELLGRMRE